jgi:hypothetical protein
MDGGILFVLDEDMDAFFQVYIEQLKNRKLYVVEQKTNIFKFFVDLDYKAPEKLSDEFLLEICERIHESLGRPGRCCIARAQPRPIKDSLIKSGVHIHWPDLKVTKQDAISNRSKILLNLPEVDGLNWSEIIDSSGPTKSPRVDRMFRGGYSGVDTFQRSRVSRPFHCFQSGV